MMSISTQFTDRARRLCELAARFEDPTFQSTLTEAFVADTAFLKSDVIKRELWTPAQLLRLLAADAGRLATRQGTGRTAVMVPKNSLGLTLAKAIASSYLVGNETRVRLPRQLVRTRPIYERLLADHLDNVSVVPAGESGEDFLRHSFGDPEMAAVVIYADDAWIDDYYPLAKRYGTKVLFEGPGNDALIVMANADIDIAVAAALRGGMNNGGQSCSAFERFFVHASRADEFTTRLMDRLTALRLGAPEDDASEVGPIASRVVLGRILRQIEQAVGAGATMRYGGQVVSGFRGGLQALVPAVLTGCTAEMQVVAAETFGPVFPILTFDKLSDLMPSLDATSYGLNAAVFGTCPDSLATYLETHHRNVYYGATPIDPAVIETRLVDGGYRRSGFAWERQGAGFGIREGRRFLADELSISDSEAGSGRWHAAHTLTEKDCNVTIPPRITPQPVTTFRPSWRATLERIPGSGLKGPLFPRNVLGTLAHSADTFGPFLDYWVTSKLAMKLTNREQELIILRMAWLYKSEYVWQHHVPVAREFGITNHELEVARGGDVETLTDRERALVEWTDELVESRTLSDGAWRRWQAFLSEHEVVDLISLVAQYTLFALVNNALRVELEPALSPRWSE